MSDRIDVAIIRARVHNDSPADASRYCANSLQTAEIVLRGNVGDFRDRGSGTGSDRGPIHHYSLELTNELDHDPSYALVGDQQIRAVAEDHPGYGLAPLLFAGDQLHQVRELVLSLEFDEQIRGTADSESRVCGHRLILFDNAAKGA